MKCCYIAVWINTSGSQEGFGGLPYSLLSNFSKEMARYYGILADDI